MSNNRCFGCRHYEGVASFENIYCSLGGGKNRIMNGVAGCSQFTPDESAHCFNGCANMTHPADGLSKCSVGIRLPMGDQVNFCREFTKGNYWSGSEKKKKGGCFISSSIMTALGEQDDCTELVRLRDFRDNVLKGTVAGMSLIDEYYDIAPGIVEKIDSLENRDLIYGELYINYLMDVLDCLDFHKYEKAILTYKRMVNFCQEKIISVQ